jgi:hypothetical protein
MGMTMSNSTTSLSAPAAVGSLEGLVADGRQQS